MSEERVQWHPAFATAIKLELNEYLDILEIEEEHQLTAKPLEVDILIIKKVKEIQILKNIARIFKKYNIIEYKSPDDYLSIDDFYKVKSYAYLYKSIGKCVNEINIDDITITMASSSYPEKMIEHLREKQGIVITNEVEGIYNLNGSDIKSQILVIDELPKRENRYVRLLTKKMNIKDDINTFFSEYSRNYKDDRYEMLMEILYTTNINQVVEVLEMAKALTHEEEQALERLIKKFNLNKKWHDEGIEKEKYEIALNALKEGAEVDFIVKITGVSKDDVLKLKEELK